MRESEIGQLCLTLSDPMDRSLPGSSIHGILQARVLEWGAIAFSKIGMLMFFLFSILHFWEDGILNTPAENCVSSLENG